MFVSSKDRNRIRKKEDRLILWSKIIIPLLAIIVPIVTILVKLYYTSNNFYSKMKEYNKAIDLCTAEIKVQQNYYISYDLERLYYEKAFNLAQLGKLTEAREYFGFAESLEKMGGNNFVVGVIQKDIEHFNLKF